MNQNMHPNDMRNMIIFAAASLLLWLAFDHFVMKPQMEAVKAKQEIVAQQAASPAAVNTPPITRDDALKTDAANRIQIDTSQLKGSISLKGGRLDDIALKNHATELHGKDSVVLLSPAGLAGATLADAGWLSDAASKIAVPNKDTLWTKTSGNILTPKTPITLSWDNGSNIKFERTISIDEKYLITIKQTAINKSAKDVVLYPFSSITRRGIPLHDKTVGYEGPLGYIGEELQKIKYESLLKEPEQKFVGTKSWVGFTEKYWFTSIVPNQTDALNYRFLAEKDPTDENSSTFQVDVSGGATQLKAGTSVENTVHVFAGVKDVHTLENYETQLGTQHFDLSIDFGMLYFLTRPMNWVISIFNSWVGNFGLAIIMLTIVVRLAVFPLASVSYRSFAGMRKIAPKMAELKIKCGDDKQKMQQELIALYQTEKVNPMAGCLPLLLQIPIFFAVYKVISIAVDMRHAPFFGWIHDLSAIDTLSVFNLFGLLPYNVPAFLHIGPWSIAMLILMLIQKQFNPPPQDKMQKDIANFMPWVISFTLSKFPSGLVIYWTFSNLFSVLQQYWIMRSMNVPVYLFAKDEALAYEASYTNKMTEAKEKAKEDHKKDTDTPA